VRDQTKPINRAFDSKLAKRATLSEFHRQSKARVVATDSTTLVLVDPPL
jgi:hypothetical protein